MLWKTTRRSVFDLMGREYLDKSFLIDEQRYSKQKVDLQYVLKMIRFSYKLAQTSNRVAAYDKLQVGQSNIFDFC